ARQFFLGTPIGNRAASQAFLCWSMLAFTPALKMCHWHIFLTLSSIPFNDIIAKMKKSSNTLDNFFLVPP
ncbi:MAG: hypothetical protein MR024_04160, partial [Firmicutes bacterium]|nr:hypothetical protein [Bacillota bacterium]